MNAYEIKNKQELISNINNADKIKNGEDYLEFLTKYLNLINREISSDDFKIEFNTIVEDVLKKYQKDKLSLLFSIEGTTGIGKSTWIR